MMLGAMPLPVRRRGPRPPGEGNPSITFDFTGMALPAAATFARTTPARGPDGVLFGPNAPRLIPGQGLLMEPPGTNLLSENVDLLSGGWIGLNVVAVGGAAGAPDGSDTAFQLAFTGGGAARYLLPVTAPPGSLTLSAWLWSPTGDPGRLVLVEDGALVTQSPIVLDGTPQRVTLTHDHSPGAVLQAGFLAGGAGDLGVRVWMPQLETGASPSTVIASSGAPGTRAADGVSLSVTPGPHDIAVYRGNGVTTVADSAAEPLGQTGVIVIEPDPDYPFLREVILTPLT